MTAAALKSAILRSMAASPFAGDITYLRGDAQHALKGCLIDEKTNLQEVAEVGMPREHVLAVHIPKSKLAFTPDPNKDRLSYQGRLYRFTLVSGRQGFAPVWVLEGRSPHD